MKLTWTRYSQTCWQKWQYVLCPVLVPETDVLECWQSFHLTVYSQKEILWPVSTSHKSSVAIVMGGKLFFSDSFKCMQSFHPSVHSSEESMSSQHWAHKQCYYCKYKVIIFAPSCLQSNRNKWAVSIWRKSGVIIFIMLYTVIRFFVNWVCRSISWSSWEIKKKTEINVKRFW